MGNSHSPNTIPLCQVITHNNSNTGYWLHDGKHIYNITDYLNKHPGGRAILINRNAAGKSIKPDIAFHSKAAEALMETYIIGSVGKCNDLNCKVCLKK
jgi:cytochrome b involved in lipid metabolism